MKNQSVKEQPWSTNICGRFGRIPSDSGFDRNPLADGLPPPNRLNYLSESHKRQLRRFSSEYLLPAGVECYDRRKTRVAFQGRLDLEGDDCPAGKHEIVFEFYPKAYVVAANISSYSSFLILLLLFAAIGYAHWKQWRHHHPPL
jgi:hypothetical protein